MKNKGIKLQLLGVTFILFGFFLYEVTYHNTNGQTGLTIFTVVGCLLSIIGFFINDNNSSNKS